jgi:hypothetical protein
MQIDSLTAARRGTREFVVEFLSDMLSELKQDAITVYMHFLSRL